MMFFRCGGLCIHPCAAARGVEKTLDPQSMSSESDDHAAPLRYPVLLTRPVRSTPPGVTCEK
jgi:hypothetical protein